MNEACNTVSPLRKAAEDWADERWEQILRDPAAANHFRDMVDAFIAGASWLANEQARQLHEKVRELTRRKEARDGE